MIQMVQVCMSMAIPTAIPWSIILLSLGASYRFCQLLNWKC